MDFTVDKYPEVIDAMGNITSTVVLIRSGSFLCIPASFEGNVMAYSDIELTKMVLDDFYNRMYPNKAENEAIERIHKDKEALEKKLSEATKIIDNHKQGMYELLAMIGAIAEHVGYEFEEENSDENSQEDVSGGGDEMEGGE